MLFARLLSKIFNKKNGIVLIDSQGQKYICGKPNLNNPLTLKLLKKDLNDSREIEEVKGIGIRKNGIPFSFLVQAF